MLSDSQMSDIFGAGNYYGLNAPYGARCFLKVFTLIRLRLVLWRLNAPYGACCFLTVLHEFLPHHVHVLMHLMVLGAF